MASAQIEIFSAPLSGAAEVPSNSSPGTGNARITVDLGLNTMRVESVFSGLEGTTTAAHIHVRVLSTDLTGGVATPTPSFPSFPHGVTSGSYDSTLDLLSTTSYRTGFLTASGGTAATAMTALVTALRDGRAYFNLHSDLYPGGELRGDLQPVPEPATMVALAAGSLIVARRRRK